MSFSSSQFSVNEDGTPITQVILTRTEGTTGEVSVTLNLIDGTATADSDYDGTPITVTFADGETSKTVDIPIINDSLIDGQETINLSLANSTNGATLGTQTTAILKLFDNDIPTTGNWVSVSNGDFESGNTNSWFGVAGERGTMGVSDDRSLFGNFSAKATTTSGFNGYGYGLVQVVNGLVVGEKYVLSGFIYTGELTSGQTYLDLNDIPNDPTARTLNNGVNQWQFVSTEFVASSSQVTVRVVRDGDVKAGESAYVDEVAITPFNQFVPVDIPMNGAIAFGNSQFSVNEDGTPITQVTLTRTEGSTGEVSVTLNLSDGTATEGSDYDGTPITVTFADGETTKTVEIPIIDDTLYESDETLNLTLSDPTGGSTLGTQQTAILNIIDNDPLPPPSLLQVRLNLLKDNGGNPGEIINHDQIGLHQSFFVEILVGDFRDNAVGVNGLQLDFNWDGFILESINSPFDPANIISSQFPLLQGGTLDNPNGLIDDLSGGSLPAFELGQAIGINQLDRFALLHFYAENITNGISYLTTAVDSVSLADDASYELDVETAQPIEILGSNISITDNSEDANDASIRFTTALSQFRKNYQDSNLIRPNYADSSKYFDITNTGIGKLTISELRINVTGVNTDLDLSKGDLILNPNESQRVKLTYAPSAAKEFFDRSDALVLVSNAVNSPELAISLVGQSTFNSDVNYDGKVGTGDLGSLNQGKANLKKGIYDPTADINGDGLFNNLDVAILQSENKLSLFA